MNYKTSETLQRAFKTDAVDTLLELAEHTIELDVTDCDDPVGEHVDGITAGIELHEQLLEVRKLPDNKHAEIYKLTYDNYADDDAYAFFIGTEEGLLTMFQNPTDQE